MTAVLLLAALPASEAPAPRPVGEPLELTTPTGVLRATLDLPAGRGPWPVVILHAGSGPTDRDGNGPLTRTDNLKMLGRALAARGIAVARLDKRGIGGSAKAAAKEEDARIEAYAADVVAWAALLRKDSRFTTLGYLGHSEGALIGLVAAADARFDAFVSLCGPGRPLQDILREQLKAGLPEKLYAQADAALTELAAGREVKDAPKELAALFRPSVQPFLIAAFRLDPAKLIVGLKGPVLVVSGSTDIQVPAADAKRLTESNPKAQALAVEGMNHVLKAVPTANRLAQLPSYSDPALPLHPKLVPGLLTFLKPALRAE